MKKSGDRNERYGYNKSPKILFHSALHTLLLLSLTSGAAAGDAGSPVYASPASIGPAATSDLTFGHRGHDDIKMAVSASSRQTASSAAVKASPAVSAVSPARVTVQVPRQLEAFARDTVAGLAQHAPFHSWNGAALRYMPLGPGTHSWLVTLEDGGKPLGYLIIAGDAAGGFTLSEYGLGSDLPYSMAPMINSLLASGLIRPGGSGSSGQPTALPAGSRSALLYHPAAPYWKVTLQGSSGKSVYIHAITNEILPSAPADRNKADARVPVSSAVTAVSVTPKASSSKARWKPDAPALSDQAAHPYHNLAWLTSPKLQVRKGSDLTRLLPADSGKSLTFTAASKQNAQYAAPFSLTGWQRWTNAPSSETVYVAVPHPDLDILRFIPADYLIPSGSFHTNPVD